MKTKHYYDTSLAPFIIGLILVLVMAFFFWKVEKHQNERDERVNSAAESLHHAVEVIEESKDLNEDYDTIMDDIYDALAWLER